MLFVCENLNCNCVAALGSKRKGRRSLRTGTHDGALGSGQW